MQDLDDMDRKPWPFPAAQPVTTLLPATRDATRRDQEAGAYEVLAWHKADECKPDADTTVLCWMADGEWYSGWWDDEQQRWMDAASGGVLEPVAWWAQPEGPLC